MRFKVKLVIFLFLLLTIINNQYPVKAAMNKYEIMKWETVNYEYPPVLLNGQIFLPLRSSLEDQNFNVTWKADGEIFANKNNYNIHMIINSTKVNVNSKTIIADEAPKLINDSTYISINLYNQISLENTAQWNNTNSTVDIISKELSIKEIATKSDQVVEVENLDDSGNVVEIGSGFIISEDGGILTVSHVIQGAKSIRIIFLDGTSLTVPESNILKMNSSLDLALIHINKKTKPVTFNNQFELGEEVITIGTPEGYNNTISLGIISGPIRNVDGHTFIQFSAPIDHGDSGGALLDSKGGIIGIIYGGIESSANINFAIPSNIILDFLKEKSN